MTSIAFPRMFTSTSTLINQDKEAVRTNLILLLSTERDTMFGDPYFGCMLKKYIYEQSNSIVVDLLIDELYTVIATFIPQVFLTRKDIKIFAANTTLFAEIKYTYVADNTSDLFTIQLTSDAEELK